MQSKRFVSYSAEVDLIAKHSLFTAVPTAQYKWMKDGEPLSPDYGTTVFYKISNAARNDSGSYQCLAHNPAGTIFSEKSEVIVACKLESVHDRYRK